MRPTIPHGYAKALAVSNHHICPHGTRRLHQCTGQQICGHNHAGLRFMRPADEICQRLNAARIVRVLDQHPKSVVPKIHLAFRTALNPDAEVLGAAVQHRPSLREYPVSYNEPIDPCLGRLAAARIVQHGHRLGRGGCLIEQARIGHLHSREVAHHGLEIHQGLQSALRDFRLVRCVGRIPTRILQHIAADHTGHFGGVVTQTNVVAIQCVFVGNPADVFEVCRFRHRLRHVQTFGREDGFRNRAPHEGVKGVLAQGGQHDLMFCFPGTEVTLDKSS